MQDRSGMLSNVVDTGSRKTDLEVGLSRGLQGMLEGLAEEIVGDGCP